VIERTETGHPSAEVLQALLESELPVAERARAEEHLRSCARCAAELDGWRSLFERLDGLPELAPVVDFSERVMAGLTPTTSLPLVARIRARLGLAADAAHPSEDRLQDYVEGLLPATRAARVRTHLDACPACAAEAAAWRTTFAHLERLERFAPSGDFATRVMAGVRVPTFAPARVPDWKRALRWVGGLVPQTRQAWATVSGVALTPAVTAGLVLWSVFSHPTLTPAALASFVWWKASALAAVAWQALSARALQSASLFEVYSFFGSLAWSPAVVAGAFVALSAGTVAAIWVLYRNLFASHPVHGRVAHASLS
jgi:anti-sigma factor RsiW